MYKKIINISDLYIKKISNDEYVKIKEHPYYLSLVTDNQELFNEYIIQSNYQSSKFSGKWENFKEIYNNIQTNKFNFSNKDKITYKNKNDKYICIHGRHRICMLLKIYGSKLKLEFENNKLTNFFVKKCKCHTLPEYAREPYPPIKRKMFNAELKA